MGTTTEPVYLRVLEDLRSRISSGVLAPGARVPSRNAIITNYGVGETAAKHALAVLLSEGLIEARPGSGCYVRKAPAAVCPRARPAAVPRIPVRRRRGHLRRTRNGAGPGSGLTRRLTWEHQTEQVPASPSVAARLGLRAGGACRR